LDVDIDPKLSWALRNMEQFPIDINTADYKMILRVPGIGVGSAKKIWQARKFGRLRSDQLKKMGIAWNRAKHFIRCADSVFTLNEPDGLRVKGLILSESNSKYLKVPQNQLTLF
ncbi:MAG: radical SAM protein, partial [Flavobacterium sp.]